MTLRQLCIVMLTLLISINAKSQENVSVNHQPHQIVKAFSDAMEDMEFEKAMQYVAADVLYTNGPNDTARGHEGILSQLEPFFAAIDENEFIIKREAVNGNVVFMERLDRHRMGDSWWELPVTGVYEVNEGKITYWQDYFDAGVAQRAMQQLAN